MNNVERVKQHIWKNMLGERWMSWIPFCFLLLKACPPGTYKPEGSPGGISTCISCPDENHTSPPGSTSLEDCTCREGYRAVGQTCEGKCFHPGTEYPWNAQCSSGTIFYVVLHFEGHVKLHGRFSLSFQTSKNAKVQTELEILKIVFLQWPIALQLVTTLCGCLII